MDRPRSDRRRVRVLHVLNQLRASGAEVMLHGAARQWKHHGVEAEILAVAPAAGSFAADLQAVGYVVAHEPDERLLRVPARLARRVRDGGFDVVHLHAERGCFYFGLAALTGGAGVVRTVHSVFGFDGVLRLKRELQRRILRRMGVVHVGVSHGVADNERLRFRNPAEIVNNWYGDEFEPPTSAQRVAARIALGLEADAAVAVSVGNCAPVKRHEAILEALAHPACPPGLMYLHVGEEEAGHAERRLVERLGLSDRTRFLGRVHPLQALHAADVFIMTSAYEGLGLAAVEAVATGLPTVLADVPGLRDVAQASPSAVLTDIAPAQLAETIGRAVRTADTRSAADLRALRARYSMQRGVACYAGIYRRLAAAGER
ncbi:glycosyltransferase [Streptomyces sp. NPDC048420]|uniref:glycosyltransferase n=1 Tax=Streptomyces sp. NPDC048420 TaxID=3155755 RepID=UPI003426D82B